MTVKIEYTLKILMTTFEAILNYKAYHEFSVTNENFINESIVQGYIVNGYFYKLSFKSMPFYSCIFLKYKLYYY